MTGGNIYDRNGRCQGVVVNKESKVLVVSQKGGTLWSLPKGHIEKGEDKISAALREIKEESGIEDLEYIRPLGSYQRYNSDRTELKTIFMFLFRAKQDKIDPMDPNNPEAKWASKDEVVKILTTKEDIEFYESILDKFN